jgi:hypothetical protein
MSRLFSWRSIYLVVALCAIAPCVGRAQTVDQDRFQKFRNSKANKDLIVRALTGVPPEVFPTCPGLGPTRSRVEVEKSISFDPDGVPNAGAWWERLPVHGCGNDTVLNVHFQARGDGTIDAQFAMPGTTHADLDLQRDAVQYAIIAAGSRAKDCRQFYVRNTLFGGHGLRKPLAYDPGKDAQSRAWWETWTVTGCNRSFDVLMEFVPDAKGTKVIQPQGEVLEY